MTHINQRRDYSTVWTETNPVLQDGEVGWEKDTRKSKLGDGVTAWNALPYTVSAINATAADIGLGNVDNTHDMDKPVSTAQQTYIDAGDAALNTSKAPKASPVFTGNPTAPTPATTDNDTSLATTAFVQAVAALSRSKRWSAATTYAVGDVVGYAGGIYRCTSAPTLAIPPALRTGNWEPVAAPKVDEWAQPDPYFASNDLTTAWQTFWKTGTVNSLAFTTTAGEFESGKRAVKVDLAANSSQRLYGLAENLVKGGEVIQLQARVKYLSGTAGQVTVLADIFQNDETGLPEPLATGVTSVLSLEGTQVVTNAWQTFTFTLPSTIAKQRATATLVVSGGTASAVILIDWIKVRRMPDLAGMTAGMLPPGVWHSVGAAGKPAFLNAWSNFDARTVQFRRDGVDITMRGLAKAGTYSVAIFQLPSGYRPDSRVINDMHLPAIQSDALGRISVNGNGDVLAGGGVAGGWWDLGGVRFKVAGS